MKKTAWLIAPACLLLSLTFPPSSRSLAPPDLVAVLNGESQVPERETLATGKAVFRVNRPFRKLEYEVTVKEIENVVAAHIHLGKPGENGPIVATLVGPLPPGKGPKSGVLGVGTLEVSDLTGPLWPGAEGTWVPDDLDVLFDQLIATFRTGGAYVSIQTNLGWAPAEPRPGNFPDGEIRGQILPPPPE